MIRLTVLYNLPPEADEDEFLRWRLGEHQASNAGIAGVAHTDFARSVEAWPANASPVYRFITTADWPDWDSFQAGFYAAEVQAKLQEDAKLMRDAVFLVSEILVSESAATGHE